MTDGPDADMEGGTVRRCVTLYSGDPSSCHPRTIGTLQTHCEEQDTGFDRHVRSGWRQAQALASPGAGLMVLVARLGPRGLPGLPLENFLSEEDHWHL